MESFGPIGIDFGTTKTALAYARLGKTPHIYRCPTVVLFEDEANRSADSARIGNAALSYESPPLAWHSFKLCMGKRHKRENQVPPDCRETPLDRKFKPPAPDHLAALVLRDLRLQLLKDLRLPEDLEVGPATITIPAESTFRQRQATAFAAYVAGFRDVSILEEPVAAYLMHYFARPSHFDDQDALISLVIDFGGGTCDMALIQSQARSVPIVLGTTTLDKGGQDIDEEIVGRWSDQERLGIELPESEQYPGEVSTLLKQMAKRTKELANPPVVRSEDVPHFLQHPFATQGEGKLREDQYRLEYGGSSLEPPKLTPDDFDAIMPGFLTEIEGGLDQLLYEIGEEPVQHIVLAGGSSYIRQFVDFVRKRFSHLYKDDKDITQFISFAEPENAIALGALEYQRNESEGKRSIRPRLSMSTYLEVDYDHEQGISEWQHRLSSVRFFRHNGKSYIELAQKGEPLKSKRPRLWPPQRLKYIPVRRSGREICWRIYQVRRVSRDEPDYKAIEPKTEPIDEIRMRLSWLQDLLPWLPISLVYAFDIYGDFYRMARPYLGLGLELKTQWEKASEFDWRDQDLIERVRQQYFQGE